MLCIAFVRRAALSTALSALVATPIACGYRPVGDVVAPSRRVEVVGARSRAAIAGLGDEAALGARIELADVGALATSHDADALRLTLIVVNVDEDAIGIAAVDGAPRATGATLRVTVRAEIHGDGAFDVPDVTASEPVASDAVSGVWIGARQDAARTAARRAGGRLARDVVGLP